MNMGLGNQGALRSNLSAASDFLYGLGQIFEYLLRPHFAWLSEDV